MVVGRPSSARTNKYGSWARHPPLQISTLLRGDGPFDAINLADAKIAGGSERNTSLRGRARGNRLENRPVRHGEINRAADRVQGISAPCGRLPSLFIHVRKGISGTIRT